MNTLKKFSFGICFLTLGSGVAWAEEEPLFDELKKRARSDAFTIGTVLQVVGDYRHNRVDDTTNGFSLGNFRFYLTGDLDNDIKYFLQASFIKSPALLDAAVTYQPRKAVGAKAGAFKAPFSAEFLLPAFSIDFVNRSQAVTLLVPGWQIGAQMQGAFQSGQLGYAVGVFNGNGLDAFGNDNNELMTAGRLIYTVKDPDRERVGAVAASVAHSVDADAPVGFPIGGAALAKGFSGERVLAGADLRVERGPLLVALEGIWSRYDPTSASRVEPWGYYATLGYFLTSKTQILGRWDSLQADGVISDSDLVLLGLNYWPTQPTEIQVNLILETATSQPGPQILINLQVAF